VYFPENDRITQLVPQMSVYTQELGDTVVPYVMRASTPDYRSEVVNTDEYSHRFSHDNEGIVDSHSWWRRTHRALALGGTFLFGAGVSSDRMTLPSLLNEYTKYSFLNVGTVAANSTQQMIAAIPFVQDAKLVLWCGGGHNLFDNLKAERPYELYGSFQGDDIFVDLRKLRYRTAQRLIRREEPEDYDKDVRFSPRSESAVLAVLSDDELEKRLQQAIRLHKRDLKFIVGACDSSVPIFFILNPFLTDQKILTEEEEELFEYYRKNVVWQKNMEPYLVQLWGKYTESLRHMCAEYSNVTFVDIINEIEYKGWCFISSGYMTDQGTRQVAHYLAQRFFAMGIA
ncbi:MAG: hypothetical protein D3916_09020, partial [Candidatus Electrothrix sp. MAN1_4]|nr:hypothetical protein [Candidatus Electrothrix sp. MAN1_4]